MQINITDEIFGLVQPYQILTAIYTAVDQHHEIMIDTSGVEYLNWLELCKAQIDADAADLLALAFGTSIFVTSKRFIQVVKSPTATNQVTFDEFTKVMLRSFFIYVENGRADKRFLYSILSPDLRRELQRQESISAISFENAGGITELAKKVDDDNKSRSKLSLRAFALFDSDALVPGAPSKDASEAQRACEAIPIPFYCLSKRAIENYLPNDALLAYAESSPLGRRVERKRIARAVGRMTEEQRSHFHMKEGFKAPHGPLYDSLNEDDLDTLSSGLGSHLSECYNEGGVADRMCLERSSGWTELENLVTVLLEAI